MSVKAVTASSAQYLYAIIGAHDTLDLGECGLNSQRVHTISQHKLTAIVSAAPGEKILPQRKHLAAHQAVLKKLLDANCAVLPMAFGIIANSPAAVEEILARHTQVLTEQLQRVDGKVEMGVRVSWDVPNIFEYFVNTDAELQAARDRLFGGDEEPRQDEKMEVGRMFEQTHTARREALTAKVEDALATCCAEIKVNRCRNEREVMNLACLVDTRALALFEQQIYAAAEMFDDNYTFDFNGPWAPYNFVDVALEF